MENSSYNDQAIGDLDAFAKTCLSSVVQFIRSTHDFPSAGDDYEFYRSFPGFQKFISIKKEFLLKSITLLLKHQGLKKNFAGESTDVDEYTDNLVECNDGLLERISALLDECNGNKKRKDAHPETSKMSASEVTGNTTPVVSSWNKVDHQGKTKIFRLLHAHNILRPQLKFKDKVDNTNAPFVPIIRNKPNALKPLSKSLINLYKKGAKTTGSSLAIESLVQQARSSEQDTSLYDHPYQFELDKWEPTQAQMTKTTPKMFDALDPDACVFIDDVQLLPALITHLRSQKEFAVDLEHHSYRSYQGITCLMQLSTRERDYIIDTLALRSDLQVLNEVFTNPSVVKVFHGADSDVFWLQRDLGVYLVNMFDTGQAARTLNLPRFSLDFLLRHYCGITTDKRFQLADWRVRPLPKEMMYYAQADTHYLLYIYDVIRNQLLEAANGEQRLLRVVLNNSRDICLLRYQKPVTGPDSHLLMLERMNRRGKRKELNWQQTEALRLLYAWRDSMARQEDESTGFVLPNHMLLQIAEILPREAQGVLACCNPIPPLVRQHVLVVHQLVMEARAKVAAKQNDSTNIDQKNSKSTSPIVPQVSDVYADILHCPHDLSRGRIGFSNHTLPDGTTQQHEAKIKSVSCLFGPVMSEAAEHDLSSENTRYASTPPKPKKNSHLERLRAVQLSAWDPFEIFMPGSKPERSVAKRSASESDACVSGQPLTLRHMLSGNFVWKMRKLEADNVAPSEAEDPEIKPQTFGTVVTVKDEARRSTGEQVQVLKHFMKSKGDSSNGARRQATLSASAVTFAKPGDSVRLNTSIPPKLPVGRGGKSQTPSKPFVPHKFSDEDFSRFRHKRGAMRKRSFK